MWRGRKMQEQTATVFGVSKSTIHTALRIGVGCIGCLSTPHN
ncbi:MAG: hypothetical protein PHG58_05425 [Clostridia bacterium]|nr:hypothetical protein [Clostridia bacterium]